MNKPLLIIILVICVLLSFFFSGAEIAYAKVNKQRLGRAIENGEKGAKITLKVAESYGPTLTTILIGNNLVNILASSIATLLFGEMFTDGAEIWTTIIMTLIILTFGEIIPKSLCTSYSFAFSKLFAVPITVVKFILTPFVYLSTKVVEAIEKTKVEETEVPDDELQEMVDTLEEQGLINEETQELISNAIDFIDVDAVEIMTHRTDVFAFDINDSLDELIHDPSLLDHSRILVYNETIDNVVGILNTKQILKLYLNRDEIVLEDILTAPLYVFETQSISSILTQLRKRHIHMAVVKDEFGGTSGILTLEDIVEELVGEIQDEKDEDEIEEYHKVNQSKFTVDGEMNIYDFFELINFDEEEYDSIYTTVSGFITDQLQKFPEEKDSFIFNGYLIQVMRADEFTVERASVTKLETEDEE